MVPGYEAKLADFGDGRLDALAATQKPPRDYSRKKSVLKEKCPSCGNVEFLRKGHYATLCEGCHDSISDLAASTPWYGGVGGTAK